MHFLAGWPANSPDLSGIEMLWSIIGHRLVGNEFSTREELFAEVKRIWDELCRGMIDRLVSDFPRR
jgi:transposase